MNSTCERLKQVVAWLIANGEASSQRELAKQLGYTPSSLSQIINGHVPLSDKFLNRLVTLDGRVNAEWIRTGEGNMLRTGAGRMELVPDDDDMEYYTENTNGARFYKQGDRLFMTVRHVPFAAYGQFVNECDTLEPDFEDWGEETYEVDHVARGNYLSFEVRGDSMDTGSRQSFEAGDKVLVRELDRVHWRDHIRFENRPYWVVVFGSSVLLKQLIAQDLEQGTLTFHSLNPSPEYADFTISENDVRHLYYVIKKKPRQMDF
ncbi:MAG: helix-turn-helix domain-containing protein [Prevotella sp.]|nr:helix-turn-helix domain-containing protein [Prevotella sp.]